MKLKLSDLDCAVRDILAPLGLSIFAEAARLAAATDEPDPELTFEQAASGVAATLVAGALTLSEADAESSLTIAHGLALATVRIDGADPGGDPIFLPASAVAAHPLFSLWVGQTFASALANLLRAGAIWTQLTPGAPVFDELQVTDYGGAVLGVHHRLLFGQAEGGSYILTASYGAAGVEVPIRRTLSLKGSTLVEIGCRAPLVSESARADEAAMASAVRGAAEAAGASVH